MNRENFIPAVRSFKTSISDHRSATTSVSVSVGGRQSGWGVLAPSRVLPALTLSAGIAVAAAGCATVPAPSTDPYLIAVRYDVEPRFVGVDRQEALASIQRDLQTVADLGFNGVVFRHVDERERSFLLDIADEAGLKVAVEDRTRRRSTPTGVLPVGGTSTGLTTIDTAAVADLASLLEGLLAQFHAGLGSGRTSGLVVDRYRRPPGDPPALTARGGTLGPAQAAAVDALLTRARHWGPRLCGTEVHPIDDVETGEVTLRVTAMTRGRRRYVLVANPATDAYARGEVLLPESIAGAVARRAVEVPPSTDRAAGRVINAQGGRIAFWVAVRPGGAALFEIF